MLFSHCYLHNNPHFYIHPYIPFNPHLTHMCLSFHVYFRLCFPPTCACVGVNVEPHRRQLHVTLAHQYLPEHHSTLEELGRTMVDPQAPSRWELRLYSRDYRLASSEVLLCNFCPSDLDIANTRLMVS